MVRSRTMYAANQFLLRWVQSIDVIDAGVAIMCWARELSIWFLWLAGWEVEHFQTMRMVTKRASLDAAT